MKVSIFPRIVSCLTIAIFFFGNSNLQLQWWRRLLILRSCVARGWGLRLLHLLGIRNQENWRKDRLWKREVVASFRNKKSLPTSRLRNITLKTKRRSHAQAFPPRDISHSEYHQRIHNHASFNILRPPLHLVSHGFCHRDLPVTLS